MCFAATLVLLLMLPIDGFPVGMSCLGEFGARPINALLYVLITYLLLVGVRIRELIPDVVHILGSAILLVIAVLGMIAVLPGHEYKVQGRLPAVQWLLHFGMLAHSLFSVCVWYAFLCRCGDRASGHMGKSSSVALAMFASWTMLEVVCKRFGWWSGSMLDTVGGFIGNTSEMRLSGLSTEPAIFASFIVFLVPLFFCLNSGNRRRLRMGFCCSAVLLAAGFLSGARTLAAALSIQVAGLLFVVIADSGAWLVVGKMRTLTSFFKFTLLSMLFACIVSCVATYGLLYLDFGVNESTNARVGFMVTGVLVGAEHPVAGVGLGQFTHYAPDFYPDVLMTSEVGRVFSGEYEFRASTFNLPVRFWAELGFMGLLAFLVLLLMPVYVFLVAVVRRGIGLLRVDKCALLVYLGGASFFLQQDQFGYQPGLFAVAFLYYYARHEVAGKVAVIK